MHNHVLTGADRLGPGAPIGERAVRVERTITVGALGPLHDGFLLRCGLAGEHHQDAFEPNATGSVPHEQAADGAVGRGYIPQVEPEIGWSWWCVGC